MNPKWMMGVVVAAVVGATPASAQAAARAPDITAPSAPAHFGVAPGPAGKITLIWDPSTDNRRVTGYQVFLNGQLVQTVSGTVFQQPTPPPMTLSYGVRAVDAAGNLSPFAFWPLAFPADTTPPSGPSAILLGGISDNLWHISWPAATDNVAVAGYEVSLNGVVLNRTSATSSDLPFHGAGGYQFRVRAFDGAGNYGLPVVQAIGVDPPPPSSSRATSVLGATTR